MIIHSQMMHMAHTHIPRKWIEMGDNIKFLCVYRIVVKHRPFIDFMDLLKIWRKTVENDERKATGREAKA